MKSSQEMLGNTPIRSLLIKMSVPATIGMLVNALYNLIDAIFIGQFAGTIALGGLTIAFPIQMLISAIALMIGIGAGSIYSRALGAKNYEKAKDTIGTAYVSAILIVALITIFLALRLENILVLFGATEEILPYARDYTSVILLGTIAITFSMVSNNLFRSEGNPKAAMIIMVTGALLNIILDPIFIAVFGLGIKGAAIATILSQYVSAFVAIYFMLAKKTSIIINLKNLKIKFNLLNEIMIVGFPSFIRNFVGSFIAITVNTLINKYGGADATIYISIYGTINRVIMFMFMPSFGVVQGFQPIVGFNYTAKKLDRVIDSMNISIRFIIIYFSISTLIILLFPNIILLMFNNDQVFIELGKPVLRIFVASIPIVGYQIIASSLYQALGKGVPATIISLLRQLILFIPLAYTLSYMFGLIGIWLAFPLADLIASIISMFMYWHEKSVLTKEYQELQTV